MTILSPKSDSNSWWKLSLTGTKGLWPEFLTAWPFSSQNYLTVTQLQGVAVTISFLERWSWQYACGFSLEIDSHSHFFKLSDCQVVWLGKGEGLRILTMTFRYSQQVILAWLTSTIENFMLNFFLILFRFCIHFINKLTVLSEFVQNFLCILAFASTCSEISQVSNI